MANNMTELVFILDKSGSMHGMESDTMGGYNSLLAKQKEEEGEVIVNTVMFSSQTTIVHDRKPIKEVEPLTEKEYRVGGNTALYDAIGETILRIDEVHHNLEADKVPEKTLFVITTDGLENASREFTAEKVKALIEQKKSENWEFLFLGADIDSVKEAGKIGINPNRSANFVKSKDGSVLMFECVNQSIIHFKNNNALNDDWSKDLDKNKKK